MNAISESVNRFGLKVAVSTTPPDSAPPPPQIAEGVCPSCRGLGYIRYDVPFGDPRWGRMDVCDEPGCEAAAAIERHRIENHIKRAGLPDKYRVMSFDTWRGLPKASRVGKDTAAAASWLWAQGGAFGGQELSEALRQTIEAPAREWLVLQGGLGMGKTGLAAAALNLAAVNGRPVLFFRVGVMFSDIQGRYGKKKEEITDGMTSDDYIERIQNARALILDEMNLPNVSNDKARLMEELIRYRHSKELPTMMTCNADQPEFARQWGERTADVIFEMAHWVKLGGAKLRAGASVL
jgi:DNA replication protein DnaC